MDAADLAALQAALMTALRRASSPEEAYRMLSRAPLSETSQRWIVGSDPRAMETALVLVKRWTEPLEEPDGAGEPSSR